MDQVNNDGLTLSDPLTALSPKFQKLELIARYMLISYKSFNTGRHLLLCLNKCQQLATDNGFRLSKTNRSAFRPTAVSGQSPIPVVEETKCVCVCVCV